MNKNREQWIHDLVYSDLIQPEDIPDIGLYMDQVTTFMETRLSSQKRYPDDKIMTKTMINNYTKNKLLPPSDRKKYSREHVLMILMIYYLKNMLSISDIQTVLEPLGGRYFKQSSKKSLNVEEIYRHVLSDHEERKDAIFEELTGILNDSCLNSAPEDLSAADQSYLEYFSLIYRLSHDIYIRKKLIERLIDDYRKDSPAGDNKKKKK